MNTTQQIDVEIWLHPSEEDHEVLEHAALKAASEALAPIRKDPDIEPAIAAKTVLAAFAAVLGVAATADNKFRALNPNHKCHKHYVDEHHIVATAIASLDSIVSNFHPYSVSGMRVLSFAVACKALEARAAIQDALECEPSMFGAHMAPSLLAIADELNANSTRES
ncbi:Uncharacterised protein [Burkholderia cepacia]|uniref:Uncharacterized protein n=1 Tax=Burkholderia cepacia TaxID=292 RepID=A0AAE8N9P0_BURCE|nr:acyl-CoA synthetase [Burkholderia cepacia]POM13912.1 hypothetical protein CSX04_08388 [Burkholderia cepacia]SPV11628.1 Uncharacterised protein [Burkholderia cepacia]